MSERSPKVIKAADRFEQMAQNKLAPDKEMCVKLRDDEFGFWVMFRQTLLIQLAAIEKRLGLTRRCKHCGNDLV